MAIALSDLQSAALSWVFLLFFIAIGIICLTVAVGLVSRATPWMKKWSGPGFLAALAGVMFSLFKVSFTQPPPPPAAPPPILVTLVSPADGTSFSIEKGTFEYGEAQPPPEKGAKALSTDVLAVLESGGYQVQLPGELANKPIKLNFKDTKADGVVWETGLFYPNKTQQSMRIGRISALEPVPARDWPSPFVVVHAATNRAAQEAKQQAPPPKFDNYARTSGKMYDRAYYEWRVFVNEPPDKLATIQQVDYLLHSSFPDPFRTTRDRSNNFEMVASGWGEFTIVITVHYTNGAIAKTTYPLNLSKSWPSGGKGSPGGGSAAAARPRLDKIRVVEDGSAGTTGWTFDIQVDGRTVMSLPRTNYDNSRAASDVVPDASHRWLAGVNVAPGQKVRIDVKGRRTSSSDTASGSATIGSGETATIPVRNGSDPKKGSFVFTFSSGIPPA